MRHIRKNKQLQEVGRFGESGSGSPAALRPVPKCQALLMFKLGFSAKTRGEMSKENLGKKKNPFGAF